MTAIWVRRRERRGIKPTPAPAYRLCTIGLNLITIRGKCSESLPHCRSIRTGAGNVGALPTSNLVACFIENPFVVLRPDFAGSFRVERFPQWTVLVEDFQVPGLVGRRGPVRAKQKAIRVALHQIGRESPGGNSAGGSRAASTETVLISRRRKFFIVPLPSARTIGEKKLFRRCSLCRATQILVKDLGHFKLLVNLPQHSGRSGRAERSQPPPRA